ncbi:MAG: TolC family protein [Candidatus Omnitrophica bacterium]|nr:TolC family protein [Candidatus Omnitrophota bacterium]MDE2223385.1 TolC family protein [Candidatus Omnitrophota bacterium]
MDKWKFWTVFILLMVWGFYPGPAFAVSLQDCKKLSLQNSPLLAAYENLIKSSIYSYRRDKSSLYGRLNAFYQPDNIQFGDRSDLARKHGFETRVGSSISWDLQKILTDFPALSRLDLTKSRLLESMARNELIKNVTQNYDRLYVLSMKKKDYLNILRLFQGHINEIKKLQSKGVDVAFDLGRAQIQYRSLTVNLKNINNEIKDVLFSLNSMMNTSYQESDFSVMDMPDMGLGMPMALNYSTLEESRLDRVELESARESFKQSRFYYLPTVQLGMEHNVNTVDPNVEEYRSFLSLNFDIFDFGQRANEEKRLKYNYEYQKELFADNQRKLRLKIEQMSHDIKSLRDVYRSTLDNFNNAKSSIETAQNYYRQGKIKEIDLLGSLSDYLTAADQSYEALYNFLSQKAELEAVLKEPRE